MLSNETIKNELIKYLKSNGVKQKYIAEAVGISATTICLFLKGRLELSQARLTAINSIISIK